MEFKKLTNAAFIAARWKGTFLFALSAGAMG
jgi:hypothetical protein